MTKEECFGCTHFRELEEGDIEKNMLNIPVYGVYKKASERPRFKIFGIPWFIYEGGDNGKCGHSEAK